MDEKEAEELSVQLLEGVFGSRMSWGGVIGRQTFLKRKIEEIYVTGFKNGFMSGAITATFLLVFIILALKG